MISQKIRTYMEDQGIKQSAISKKTGMTKQALSESLSGNRRLSAEEYVCICGALGVSTDFFNQEQTAK